MREQYTRILLPGGEWLDNLKQAMRIDGLGIVTTDNRNYEYSFVEQGLPPILFTVIRSGDVYETLLDQDIQASGGFTGSDILTEQGQSYLWAYELVAQLFDKRRPMIVLGSTPNLRNRETEISNDSVIYTSYPNITERFFAAKNISPRIKKRAGKIEAYWTIDPENDAIIDIASTGDTMQANQIRIMEVLMSPELVFMERDNVSRQDKERCEDLREIVYQSNYRRGAPENMNNFS